MPASRQPTPTLPSTRTPLRTSSPDARRRSACRCCFAGRGSFHGPSPTLLAGPSSRPGIQQRSSAFTAGLRQALVSAPAARFPRSHRAGDRAQRTVGRGRRAAPRAAPLRLASRHAGSAAPDAPDRPAVGRGCALGRPAQEVAPVRQQGAQERDPGRRRHGRSPAGVLLDLPGNGQAGRLHHPDLRVLSDRLAGVRKARDGPPLDGRNPGRERAGDALSCCASAIGSSSRTAG